MITDIAARLVLPQTAGRTEADIQADIRELLIAGECGLETPQLEVQTQDGTRRRIDVQVGATVIEVKKDLSKRGILEDGAQQLAGYVATQSSRMGSRYNGILTDGQRWFLYETTTQDRFEKRSEFTLKTADSAHDLASWLTSVMATRRNVCPTQDTIMSLLGAESPAYAQDHAYLRDLYAELQDDPTVQLKRALWARLLRSALGTNFNDQTNLFLDHTLLVIQSAAIGHLIMGVEVSEVISAPSALLTGEHFRNANISNVIDPDFFDWILAHEQGEAFLSRTIQRVSAFDWDSTQHDVLKVLYESVIQSDVRKSLGEYYTPDWLAEGIIEKTVTDPLEQRVLDASCGSGTFIFHAIRHHLKAAREAGYSSKQAIDSVQQHVFGLDIHPVSVTLAKITYLLALGPLLSAERNSMHVPVYLGDAIQWSQDAAAQEKSIEIRVDSVDMAAHQPTLLDIAEVLKFPLANIDDPATFDRLVSDLTKLASKHNDPMSRKFPRLDSVLQKYGIGPGSDADTLKQTFNLLCELNAQKRDSIWGYFVRNQVRPLWFSMPDSEVDVLVGNPPWVAYRFMTSDMKRQFRSFSESLNLWHGGEVATNQDLVSLFIARASELYLKDGGAFGYVTPQAVLSRQQYEGFRRGKWGAHSRASIQEVWDLERMKPSGFFPVQSAVLYGKYYSVNSSSSAAHHGMPDNKVALEGRIDSGGWQSMKEQITFQEQANVVVASGASTSPYASTVVQGATIVPRYLHFVEESTRRNKLGSSSAMVKVSSSRSKQEKSPWKDRESLVGNVERRFVYSVHLGSTIADFMPLETKKALLPIDSDAMLNSTQIEATHGLSEWWEKSSLEWESYKSKSSRMGLMDRLDFHNGLTKQLGGAKHRVLYSASGNRISAARIEEPQVVIEHSLYWMPAKSIREARYLTAVLNSPEVTRRVSSYQSRGLFGARHFDKYIWLLDIPIYNENDDIHNNLVSAAIDAEKCVQSIDYSSDMSFQKVRKSAREALNDAGITTKLDQLVISLLGEIGC